MLYNWKEKGIGQPLLLPAKALQLSREDLHVAQQTFVPLPSTVSSAFKAWPPSFLFLWEVNHRKVRFTS